MTFVYVAASKTVQEWTANVGVGKNVYRVGVVDAAEDIAPSLEGVAGASDWKVLMSAEWDGDEESTLARLAKKEKVIDPNYYPKLKGASGVVKVDPMAVENSMLIAFALDNVQPPKNFKVKPVDIAQYLIKNLGKG